MKKVKWIKNAYRSTSVNWAKSQSAIYKLLGEIGIYEIRFTNLKDKFVLEFIIQIDENLKEKPRAVRIVVPLKFANDESKREKELNIVHRILFNHLKSKFIAVATGVTEFEQEFMSHLVITDKQGNSTTMGESLLPQYKENLESGENKDFLLGDGR